MEVHLSVNLGTSSGYEAKEEKGFGFWGGFFW